MLYPPGVTPKEAEEQGIPMISEELTAENLKCASTEYLLTFYLKLYEDKEMGNDETRRLVKEELDRRAVNWPKKSIVMD